MEEIKKYSYQDFKESANIFCYFIFILTYLFLGFFQFFVIWTSLTKILHHDSIMIAIISFLLGFIPIIGTVFGIFAVHFNWGWSFSHALIILVIPYLISNTPLFMITLYDIYTDWKRWQICKKDV